MLWPIGLWVSIVLGLVSCKGQVVVTSHSTTDCSVRPIPRLARCRGGTTLTHTPLHTQPIIAKHALHAYPDTLGTLSNTSMFMLGVWLGLDAMCVSNVVFGAVIYIMFLLALVKFTVIFCRSTRQ